MWLSKQIVRRGAEESGSGMRVGRVSLANGQTWGVVGTSEVRRPPTVTPYGVRSLPVEGTDLLLAQVEGGPICLGAVQSAEDLLPGEVELKNAHGFLRLCQDGRVVINGLTITPEGDLLPPRRGEG